MSRSAKEAADAAMLIFAVHPGSEAYEAKRDQLAYDFERFAEAENTELRAELARLNAQADERWLRDLDEGFLTRSRAQEEEVP